MLERQRHREILRALAEHNVLTIKQMTELLGVSEATVRRDVRQLAANEQLRKIRGGAEAVPATDTQGLAGRPFEVSRMLNVERKRAIAKAAAGLCRDGESIIINGGTTTYMMVEFLASRRLQILTNSFSIAETLNHTSANRIILPGGEIYRKQQIVLSPFDTDVVQNHYASKMFMGAQGLGIQGLMEVDPLLIQAEKKLIGQADRLIVMVDSSKFQRRGSLILCPLDRIDMVITDGSVKDEHATMLTEAGIEVLVAESLAPDRARADAG